MRSIVADLMTTPEVKQSGIVNVIAVAEKNFVIDGHQLNLKVIEILRSAGHLHHVPKLVRDFCRCQNTAAN